MAMTVVGRKESISHAGWNDRIFDIPGLRNRLAECLLSVVLGSSSLDYSVPFSASRYAPLSLLWRKQTLSLHDPESLMSAHNGRWMK
jgi:hypothetical protein